MLQFLPIAAAYFGVGNYMVPYYKSSNILLKPLNLLEGEQYSKYYLLFVYGILSSIIAFFFFPLKRLSLIITYILLMNLYHKTAPLQNGGFSLLTMVLFCALLRPFFCLVSLIDSHPSHTLPHFFTRYSLHRKAGTRRTSSALVTRLRRRISLV